jgi:hypothetical protein
VTFMSNAFAFFGFSGSFTLRTCAIRRHTALRAL